MSFYADLHVHSKYSYATSKNCDLENLAFWARKKGIQVIGTGDFTHPLWLKELKEKLIPAEPGLFKLKPEFEKAFLQDLPSSCQDVTRFMLSVEVSTIYRKGDKTRKVHHLIYAPSFEQAEKINQKLAKIGNLEADGRPTLGLDSRHLLEIVLEAAPDGYLVPAHVWTPWFAIFGSKSGFDSVTECYGDLAKHVFALETGLSSDPQMNWRISHLDRFCLMSNSDAHSPAKLGREANLFHCEMNYFAMKTALETGIGFGGTVEFFPEEGKYHLDGHRRCGVRLAPQESRARHGLCPHCHQPLTLGVMHRVEDLADRAIFKQAPASVKTKEFQSLIPLPEILSELLAISPSAKGVTHRYDELLQKLGPELSILNQIPVEEIKSIADKSGVPHLEEAIARMRRGEVIREAGFDGEYGRIKLFGEKELCGPTNLSLF